jgi:hypothetical protein
MAVKADLENMTLDSLVKVKTKDEVIKWANDFGKCPYDFKLESEPEDTCQSGEDQAQCVECWKNALKDVKCKGDRKGKAKEVLAKETEGEKALKDLCKGKTREEFEQMIKENNICPGTWGLENFPEDKCQKHAIKNQCLDCWKPVVKDYEFKASEEPKEDQQPAVGTTELVAPPNTNNLPVLAHMDNLVEQIKNLEAQKKTWSEMLKAKIQEATVKVEAELAKLDSAIAYNKSQLSVDFKGVDAKESKTQFKVSVISGDVILKKATTTLDYDKAKLLKWAKDNKLTDYIKTKEEFDWAKYKGILEISGDTIIDTTTGEVVTADGVMIKEVEEELIVK